MSLDNYCRDRLVVLNPNATTYEAARAMESNHVGAIVVRDRRGVVGIVTDRDLALKVVGSNLLGDETLVYEVMTLMPATISIGASELDALREMQELRVRRLVILDGEHLAGLVTLDDLILSGAANFSDVRNVIRGQLAQGSRGKPWGYTRPQREYRRGPPEQRREARRSGTMHAFTRHLMQLLELKDPDSAIDAFEVVAANIVRRLMPDEADAFTAQLPALMRERLMELPGGPDRRITRRFIEEEMARRLDVDADRAAELVDRVSHALSELISEGELDDARRQLPMDLKTLLQPTM